jgi:hypothetical protein
MFSYLRRLARRGAGVAGATLAAAALISAAGCGDKTVSGPSTVDAGSNATTNFNQVQRLGNPLVSEVLLLKRDHAFHGSTGPETDVANFAPNVKGFIAQFRPQATGLQSAIAGTLLPDMLIVDTSQPQATAGYLSYVLSSTGKAYGGRKLTDDVVDISLSAVFSDLLDPTQFVCKPFALPLCTDNVASHGAFTTTFPYLATAK